MDDLCGYDLFAALEMQTRHTLVRAFILIPYVCICLNHSREYAEVCHLSDERIGGRLPHIGSKLFIICRLEFFLTSFPLCYPFWSMGRRRHQINNIVEQCYRAN